MSQERAESSLSLPDLDVDYSEFPTFEHKDRLRWYRAHQGEQSPWWFSSSDGRFNLFSPRGTLNLGSSSTTALRERLGPVLLGSREIPETALAGVEVSCLEIPQLSAADFLHEAAASFGVLAADASAPMDPTYTITRRWAHTFDRAGMGGIRTRSRFGAGRDPQCLFMFGSEGEHELGDILDSESASANTIVADMAGYNVESVPDSGSIVIDP